jgi:hypothetical protein
VYKIAHFAKKRAGVLERLALADDAYLIVRTKEAANWATSSRRTLEETRDRNQASAHGGGGSDACSRLLMFRRPKPADCSKLNTFQNI